MQLKQSLVVMSLFLLSFQARSALPMATAAPAAAPVPAMQNAVPADTRPAEARMRVAAPADVEAETSVADATLAWGSELGGGSVLSLLIALVGLMAVLQLRMRRD